MNKAQINFIKRNTYKDFHYVPFRKPSILAYHGRGLRLIRTETSTRTGHILTTSYSIRDNLNCPKLVFIDRPFIFPSKNITWKSLGINDKGTYEEWEGWDRRKEKINTNFFLYGEKSISSFLGPDYPSSLQEIFFIEAVSDCKKELMLKYICKQPKFSTS